VYITIKGTRGKLPKRQLLQKSAGKRHGRFRFNKATTHVFKFDAHDVGDVSSVVVEVILASTKIIVAIIDFCKFNSTAHYFRINVLKRTLKLIQYQWCNSQFEPLTEAAAIQCQDSYD